MNNIVVIVNNIIVIVNNIVVIANNIIVIVNNIIVIVNNIIVIVNNIVVIVNNIVVIVNFRKNNKGTFSEFRKAKRTASFFQLLTNNLTIPMLSFEGFPLLSGNVIPTAAQVF